MSCIWILSIKKLTSKEIPRTNQTCKCSKRVKTRSQILVVKCLTSTYKSPDVVVDGLSCPSSPLLYPGLACCECSVAKTEHLTENKWKTYSTTQGTAQITGLPKLMPLTL